MHGRVRASGRHARPPAASCGAWRRPEQSTLGPWPRPTAPSFASPVYRLKFNESFAEMNRSTNEWKTIVGTALFFIGFTALLLIWEKHYGESGRSGSGGPPAPASRAQPPAWAPPGTACRVSRALSCCEVGPRFPSGLPAPQPVVRRRGGARRGRRAPPAAGLPLPPKTESVAVSGSPLALVLSVQRRRRFPEVVSPCACGLPGPGSVTDPGLSRLPRPPWVLFVLSACCRPVSVL